jgi:hypothetical protein
MVAKSTTDHINNRRFPVKKGKKKEKEYQGYYCEDDKLDSQLSAAFTHFAYPDSFLKFPVVLFLPPSGQNSRTVFDS